jgi:hypothetical protein
VSGFGGVSHTNSAQFINLESVTFSAGKIGSSYTPLNASNGTLTVTSGSTVVAKIAFAGSYVASDFHITSDGTGHVLITDPGVPFGGGVTLGFGANGNQHGDTLRTTLGTAATAALFGHYIAGSLATGAGAYGGGLTVEGRGISRAARAFDAASRLMRSLSYCASACCRRAVGVATSPLRGGGAAGLCPSELRNFRNTPLLRSTSCPAVRSISTWSGGNLKRVSTALSAADRSGPNSSKDRRVRNNLASWQFHPDGAP